MPYYQYRCNDCENEFEKRQRMSDDPLTECPVCNGRIRRVVNSVGVVFKGSGFYVTDTRNGKNASAKNGVGKTAESKAEDKSATEGNGSKTTKKTETAKKSTESKAKEPAPASK